MARIHYRIVAHDGGWAYKLNDVFSEPFVSKSAALAAAKKSPPSSTFPVTPHTSSFRMKTACGILNCPRATIDPMSMSTPDATGPTTFAASRGLDICNCICVRCRWTAAQRHSLFQF